MCRLQAITCRASESGTKRVVASVTVRRNSALANPFRDHTAQQRPAATPVWRGQRRKGRAAHREGGQDDVHESAKPSRSALMSDMLATSSEHVRLRPITVDDYHRMGDAGILRPDERVQLTPIAVESYARTRRAESPNTGSSTSLTVWWRRTPIPTAIGIVPNVSCGAVRSFRCSRFPTTRLTRTTCSPSSARNAVRRTKCNGASGRTAAAWRMELHGTGPVLAGAARNTSSVACKASRRHAMNLRIGRACFRRSGSSCARRSTSRIR